MTATNKSKQLGENSIKISSLFTSSTWHEILRLGFSARSLMVTPRRTHPLSMAVFQKFGFKIGYLGFPAGLDKATVTSADFLQELVSISKETGLHSIRFSSTHSLEQEHKYQSCVKTPSTRIKTLQEWNPETLRKVKRIQNRQKRTELEITTPVNGHTIYNLYKDTVIRNGGALRYTEDYFNALVASGKSDCRINCRIATLKNDIAGFNITAYHNSTAFYLHGGTNSLYKQHYPSDMLFLEAISKAKEDGMTSYDMMSSPANQPSLTKYKEKWGGSTETLNNYSIDLKPATAKLMYGLHKIYNKLT